MPPLLLNINLCVPAERGFLQVQGKSTGKTNFLLLKKTKKNPLLLPSVSLFPQRASQQKVCVASVYSALRPNFTHLQIVSHHWVKAAGVKRCVLVGSYTDYELSVELKKLFTFLSTQGSACHNRKENQTCCVQVLAG